MATDYPSRVDLFTAKYVVSKEGCWLWTAGTNGKGYGAFRYEGGTLAHRFSYTHFVGPIPDGMVLDHLCRVPLCVNPNHLEPVTQSENLRRGEGLGAYNSAKTSCRNGHDYTDENTYVSPKGERACRECARASWRRGYVREKARCGN